MSTFENRRVSDPQGVIDDLLAQTARQAKCIHDLNTQIEKLKNPETGRKKKSELKERAE